MEDILDKINQETEDYYNSIREGSGLKKIMKFNEMDDLDELDLLLDDLKGKNITMTLPDKTPEEDEAALWMKQRLEEQRELERKGKKKIKW